MKNLPNQTIQAVSDRANRLGVATSPKRSACRGATVLVSAAGIEKIDSPEKKIHLRLTQHQIRNSPSMGMANIELIETLPTIFIM